MTAALGLATLGFAQETPLAFTGAQLIPIAGEPISDGVLVVQRGKILAVGPAGAVAIPAGAEIRPTRGKVIMPGLVDSHSHIGGAQGADGSAPIQPDVRVLEDRNAGGVRILESGHVGALNPLLAILERGAESRSRDREPTNDRST